MAQKKIASELAFGTPHRIGAIVAPFFFLESDPDYRKPKKSTPILSRKVLTISKWWRILRDVIKQRKGSKMASSKNNKLNAKQYLVGTVMAVAALNGITEFLGGTLRDAVVAAILVGLLIVTAIED